MGKGGWRARCRGAVGGGLGGFFGNGEGGGTWVAFDQNMGVRDLMWDVENAGVCVGWLVGCSRGDN